MNPILENHLDQIGLLCRTNGVNRLFAFGSVVNEEFNPEKSDLDFLVEVNEPDPLKKGRYLLNLWDSLEMLFKRKVDLLTPESLRNPYLIKSINHNKVLIYEK